MLLQNIRSSHQAKATFLYQAQERSNFPLARTVLLVSVGQEVHEGKKLGATLELVSKNFKSCDVIVCDVLQRHTMQISDFSPAKIVYEKSKLAGKYWIERNLEHLQRLKIPYRIFFWEEFLSRSAFSVFREKIMLAYQGDATFKTAMDDTINDFVTRYERRLLEIDRERAFTCCLNYLIEESAIIMLMWQAQQYHYIVYPGKMPKVLGAARNKFVLPNNPDILKWVTVYVRSRGDNKHAARGVLDGNIA